MDQVLVADGFVGKESPKKTPGKPVRQSASNKRLTNGQSWRHCRILSAEELATGQPINWQQLEIRGFVKNLSPNLFTLHHLTALFLNDNDLQHLPPDISKLTNLRILDASNNKLLTVPPELGDLASLENLYLNNNLIRALPFELGKLCKLKHLGLAGNPLTPEIKQIYRLVGGTVKLLQHFMCQLCGESATSPIPERHWVPINQNKDSKKHKFTVMCYNVLCDKYATTSAFSFCPPWALSWPYRQKGILQELHNHSADILSLQEVETEQFDQLFLPELQKQGYEGVFAPKSRAKTMTEDERKFVDGCALFWKASKFQLIERHLIEFTQLAIANADGCQHMLNRVMTRDNIALVAVLKPLADLVPESSETQSSVPLTVCTAHIHWDPEFCDVKLVQTMMMVQELERLINKVAETCPPLSAADIPLIICGDFNSLPNSGVYEFLSSGKIDSTNADLKEFRNQKCLQRITLSSDNTYGHEFRLQSAYDPDMLSFTNYTVDFKGVIDYIFATPKTLERLSVLGPTDDEWFAKNKIVGCPNPNVPSDHIPLVAEYALLNFQKNHVDQGQEEVEAGEEAEE